MPTSPALGSAHETPDLTPLFYPRNIAVIGASHNPVGGLKYILAHETSGFAGDLYPINPKYEDIEGRKVYPSILANDLPDIDLAIVAIPARHVPAAIRECHQKGVKFAVVFSSGFSEAGNEAIAEDLRAAVAEGPTRVIGPNCLGVYNYESKVTFFPNVEYLPGNVSIVSQSGGTTARLTQYLISIGIGIAKVVSIGNSIDLSITDLLAYFKDDPHTETVVLYMESIPDGRRFLRVLREVTREKKVIVWKGGQTETGGKAAQSHTGGLAGTYTIWKAALKQHGAIVGEYFEEVIDLTAACSLDVPLPKSKKVGIVISGGGLCVEFTDTLIRHGLEVPALAPETQARIGQVLPDVNTAFRNPVDMGEYGYLPQYFGQVIDIVARDPNLGSLVFVRETDRFEAFKDILKVDDFAGLTYKVIKKAIRAAKIPFFMMASPNVEYIEYIETRYQFRDDLYKLHIPYIAQLPHLARVIVALYEYETYLAQFK